MSKIFFLSSAALILSFPVAAIAKEEPAAPLTATAAGVADGAATADDGQNSPKPGKEIVITGHLDRARASIQPSLGATTYTISNETIQELPGGDNQQINQILLQLPGVTQDGFGQFHVRDDHNNLQYRINGTILPEGIAVFGQTLSPRLVDQFDLRTGALPAQYGLRTAGIIDITTKNGLKNGGQVSIYGGSNDRIEPSFEYGGSGGGTNYFVTGSYRHSSLGIEAVDGGRTALHDETNQYQSFAYVDRLLGDGDRVSFIGGYSDQTFQIPNPRGLHPDAGFDVGGVTDFVSDDLDERQHERTAFGIASYLHDAGPLTLQGSLFARYSSLRYSPDILGELLFNGIAQRAYKQDFTFGGQVDAAYRLSDAHTLRGGFSITRDRSDSQTTTQVFPGTFDNDGNFTQGGQPISIPDNYLATEIIYSAYLQDEWRPFAPLTINFGGRFDHYDGFRSESQFSPRVNAVLSVGHGLTLHAGYARYFSPAPFANVAVTTVARFVNTSGQTPGGLVGTVPFAERQDYFDIGLQQVLGHFTVSIDGYHRRSRNLIDEGQFGAPIILTPFNYAKGRIDGVEGAINYQHGPLLAYVNLAWAKAQGRDIVSGEFNFDPADVAYIRNNYIYLDHDQTWTASAGASYRIASNTRVGATMIYGSGLRRDGDVPNGGKLTPYATFNLTASHKFERPGIEIRADITNLFDRVYEIRDGSGIGVGAPQYGARRAFFFGISKTI
ncbi:MAG: TonB-dependent receptor [Sphingomonas sp.]|jgi:outer membrane cobalamin receptor